MNTNLTRKFALAALLALLTTASIRAGTITVVSLPATGTDAATGISTANTYVCCLAFGTNANITINGVPFQSVKPNNTVTSVNGTDNTHGGTYTLTANHNLNSTSNTNATGEADGNTLAMLGSVAYVASSAPVGSWLVQDYGGLAVGGQYALRIYYRQWSTTGTRAINIAFDGEGTNQAYTSNPLNEDAGGAHYIEYDFTANSGDVFMYMTNLTANESAMIYGMSLQQTAPPVVNVAPTINTQPVGFTNLAGLTGSLSVRASGAPVPTYQWFQNSLLVPNYTNAGVQFIPLDPTNGGLYYVIVTNVAGSITSSVVSVGVLVNAITNVISSALSQVRLPAIGTDAATGIGAGSNYLCLLDFGSSAFSGAVNGITFTPVNLTETTQSGTDPNYGGTATASTTDTNGFKDVAGGGASISAQADGKMASVLAGASYLGTAPVATTATLSCVGLAPGAKYSLRYYYRQWTAGDLPTRPVQFVFNGDGTNATFETDEDIGGAYYLEYDFTAAGNTVSLVLTDESGVVNQGPMIYAVTLQLTAPVLNYSLSGTSLTLFWDPSITNYVLETVAQLSAAATSWTPVPGVVNNSVTVDASTGAGFFRLLRQ